MKRAVSIVCTALFMVLSLFWPAMAEEQTARLVFTSFEDQILEVKEGESVELPETLAVHEEDSEELFDLSVNWNGDLDLNTVGEYTLHAESAEEAFVLSSTPTILVRVLVKDSVYEEGQNNENVEESAEEESPLKEDEDPAEENETVEEEGEASVMLMSLEPVDGVYEGSSMEDLKEAFEKEEKEIRIRLTSGFEMTETLTVAADKTIELSGASVSIKPGSTKKLFRVVEGGTLKILDGITFDLDQKNASVVDCLGNLEIHGSTITNGKFTTSHSGLVYVHGNSAALLMDGGTFKDNKIDNSWNGVLCIEDQAVAEINGGSVTDNVILNQWSAPITVYNASAVINGVYVAGNTASELYSSGGLLVGAMVYDATAEKHGIAETVMNGGLFENNKGFRGGAVSVITGGTAYSDLYSSATFTMNSGTIKGNSVAPNKSSLTPAGGGIYVECGSKVILNDGQIENNTAYSGNGGGVATADGWTSFAGKRSYSSVSGSYNGQLYKNWEQYCPAGFEMNGGVLRGNTATAIPGMSGGAEDHGCGGGLYIASNKVRLNAGVIENNEAEHQGGGIYVSSVPYVLNMIDTVITDNHAVSIGGGIWTCPTGTVENSVNNGGAVYGNTGDGAGDDIATERSWNNATLTVSDRMLGGGKVTWYHDGAVKYEDADSTAVRFESKDSSEVYVPKKYDETSLALHAEVEEEGKTAALELADLVVRGNSASKGGGIGSNGTVRIGKSYESPIDVVLNKKFEGDRKRPVSVTIHLLANGHRIDSMELNEENGWSGSWTGLPSIDVVYTVEEEPIQGWIPSVEHTKHLSGDQTFTVTNQAVPDATVQLKAEKYLDHREPNATWSFELLDEEGTVLQTVRNTGKDILFEELKFKNAGTTRYRVREVVGNDRNIVYDMTVYEVTITVDDRGQAVVVMEKNGAAVSSLRFDNTSKPKKPEPVPTPTPVPPSQTPRPTPPVAPYTPKTGRPYTPNTGDPLLGYALLFGASIVGLILVKKR